VKLRDRFALTLVAIAVILVAPAVYGLYLLGELRQVAEHLRSRDAVGALALGRLQTAFGELGDAETIYLALANQPEAERDDARRRLEMAARRVDTELVKLSSGGYAEAVRPAQAEWRRLQATLQHEQALVQAGAVDSADVYSTRVVAPALAAVDESLNPISRAINASGEEQIQQARDIAARAQHTTLLALAVALAVALTIAGWLARSVLVPIRDLRRAMAVVAAGDFEPDLHIRPDRTDEIGDLGRSFRSMTEQLKELERLRAEFVSVASHELKTPLSVIKGYAALLRDGIYGDVPEEQEKVLDSIGDQSDRLGRLIQQLLDVSRFEAGGVRLHIQEIDARSFLEELATSFEALAVQNEIDFRLETPPELPPIHGDPDRLNEVVGNLLSNAFKFTPRGGRIRLRVRPGSRGEERGVCIEVYDTGVGIPPEKLPRIFDKFYQVENEAQPLSVGSGLGLAISREITEAHGGTITAESRPGDGTTFQVFLPDSPPSADTERLPESTVGT
jgi:signal transduction histidine kinase